MWLPSTTLLSTSLGNAKLLNSTLQGYWRGEDFVGQMAKMAHSVSMRVSKQVGFWGSAKSDSDADRTCSGKILYFE